MNGESVKKSLGKNIRAGSKRLIDESKKENNPKKTSRVKPGKAIKRRSAGFSSQSDQMRGRGGGVKNKNKLNGKQIEKTIFD